MKLSLSDKAKVNQLVTLFKHLKNVVTDVNIHLTPSKFYIQGVDMSHVCLIETNIKSDWFDSFEVETDIDLGVNCDILAKVIDCWKEGQKIIIYSENYDNLYIDFEGDNTMTKMFKLPLMDIDTEILVVPKGEYQVDLAIKSSEFKEIINELSIFSPHMQLNCKESPDSSSGIILKASEEGSMKVEIKEEDILYYAVEENCSISVSYSIRYIDIMCAFYKLNSCLYIHGSSDKPLKMHYSLDEEDGEQSQNYVRFYIAPRIDND